MSQAPVLPLFTDALIGDTMHLSRDEFGGYLLLLIATWRNNGVALPDDPARMARICRCSKPHWLRRLRPAIVGFFDVGDGFWHQKRLEKEWQRTQVLHSQKSSAAKSKWLKQNEASDAAAYANGMRPQLTLTKGLPKGNPPLNPQRERDRSAPRGGSARSRLNQQGKDTDDAPDIRQRQTPDHPYRGP